MNVVTLDHRNLPWWTAELRSRVRSRCLRVIKSSEAPTMQYGEIHSHVVETVHCDGPCVDNFHLKSYIGDYEISALTARDCVVVNGSLGKPMGRATTSKNIGEKTGKI